MINKIEEQEKKEKASLFLQCEALFVDPDARKKIDELFEKEYQDFTKPSGIVTAQVCKESGKLAIAGVCDADPRGSA